MVMTDDTHSNTFDARRGRRMTGSAMKFTEWSGTFYYASRREEKERVWERKGLGVGPGGRLADDGKRNGVYGM